MGGWSRSGTRRLRSRTRRLHRRRSRRFRWKCWLVPARSAGSLRAVLSRERSLCESRQHQQHDGKRHAGHQRLSHHHHQQHHHQHHEYHLCEPWGTRSGNGGSAARVHQCAAGGTSQSAGKRTADRVGAIKWQSCCCSHARKRPRIQSFHRGARDCATSGSCKSPGRRQENSASASRALCEAAAGTGRASGRTARPQPDANSASRGSSASYGQGSATQQAGYGDHWPSSCQRCATRSTSSCASSQSPGNASGGE